MKKKITYKKAPSDIADAITSSLRVKDFLPPPEKLVKKDDTIRITINLNKRAISFFKAHAKKHGVPYQKMINRVLDYYVKEFGSK